MTSPTVDVIDEVSFSLVKDLNERQVLIMFLIQRAVLPLVDGDPLLEVFNRLVLVHRLVVRTRHFHLLANESINQKLKIVYSCL